MTNNQNPIGIFDSGVGGTSIWREIHKLLPKENTIYLADSKNAPYGQKSKEEIISLSYKNTEKLLDMNAKIIVVACNTATTNAIKELRQRFDIPFIGIEPAIKPAANYSVTKNIGILATKGTLNSELFHSALSLYPNITVFEQIGYGLVELIENGDIESPEMFELLNTYLSPMIEKGIDYLVLGCSHYPYLIPQIKKILPRHITIIDSGKAVARQTQNLLSNIIGFNNTAGNNEQLFFTNANPKVLQNLIGSGYKASFMNF